jgi:hypothetical protein
MPQPPEPQVSGQFPNSGKDQMGHLQVLIDIEESKKD